MDAGELKRRTMQFALRVLKLARALPRTPEGRAVRAQIVRAGTAVGANYRSTCRARSRKEFVAKVGVVEEEADETAFWLELVIADGMVKPPRVAPLPQEANELTAIMAASRKSAQR